MTEFDSASRTIEQTYTHPLVYDGYDVIYDKNIIVRVNDERDQTYNFKIAQKQNEDDPSEIMVQMSLENDIYSVEIFQMDSESYPTFIQTQKYRKCKFENFAEHLALILENARTNRSSYNIKFNMNDGSDLLELQQRLEFKTVDIFKIEFHLEDPDDQYVHDQAQYRYHLKISDYNNKKNEIRHLLDHVRRKNPAFASQLEKSLKIDL